MNRSPAISGGPSHSNSSPESGAVEQGGSSKPFSTFASKEATCNLADDPHQPSSSESECPDSTTISTVQETKERTLEAQLQLLKEENESIKKELDEKNSELKRLKKQTDDQINALKTEIENLQKEKIVEREKEIETLRKKTDQCHEEKETLIQRQHNLGLAMQKMELEQEKGEMEHDYKLKMQKMEHDYKLKMQKMEHDHEMKMEKMKHKYEMEMKMKREAESFTKQASSETPTEQNDNEPDRGDGNKCDLRRRKQTESSPKESSPSPLTEGNRQSTNRNDRGTRSNNETTVDVTVGVPGMGGITVRNLLKGKGVAIPIFLLAILAVVFYFYCMRTPE